ncbi:MAG: phosphoadenosine phosphosulfate reductase domain-containing protein [Candidatus Heimdallarchaeaceae archaeon]
MPYLGKNTLFYCYECDLPIIKTHICPACGNKIDLLPLTPPFDVRPAKKKEVEEIQELIKGNFGEGSEIFTDDDIVLLNHLGSEDQMDEIIVFGKSIGTRRYDLLRSKWIIKLNSNGLSLLEGKITKNWVKIDSGAKEKIIQGANILIPGVLDADEGIEKGNYIAVIDEEENIIAGGIARIDENERKNKEKGVYAKNYLSVKEAFKPKKIKYSWDDVVKYNIEGLRKLENESIEFVRKIRNDLQLPMLVSFSGGKDSLVTLSIIQQAFSKNEYKVMFVDTGIEFPETVRYVKDSSVKLDFQDQLITEEVSSELFWEAFDKFGPPGRDFRHCCKFAKLAPIQKAISQEFNNGKCISFVGQRRYESFRRAISDIWENQYIPNQINVSPIQEWTAFMIWLYIIWKDLPYNPLYDIGYERIGCWACPSSDMAQFEILRNIHPELHELLYNAVEKWKDKRSLPEDYWKYGLWRFKKLPKKILSVLSINKKEYMKTSKDLTLSSLQIEASDCVTQPISVIGTFSGTINLNTIVNFLPILGRVQFNKRLNFIRISNKNRSILVYSDGTFKINFKKHKILTNDMIHDTINTFTYAILRALGCIGCSLCKGKCEYEAISFQNNTIFISEQLCSNCNHCFDVCPIVTVVHKGIKNRVHQQIQASKHNR